MHFAKLKYFFLAPQFFKLSSSKKYYQWFLLVKLILVKPISLRPNIGNTLRPNIFQSFFFFSGKVSRSPTDLQNFLKYWKMVPKPWKMELQSTPSNSNSRLRTNEIKDALSGPETIFSNWRVFKNNKNGFHFTSNAFLVLKILKCLSWFFGHIAKWLD